MKKINNILLFALLTAIVLAEITRIPIVYGVAVSLIDIVAASIFIYVFAAKKLHVQQTLFKPIGIFVGICVISLLVNIYWLSPSEIVISFLYSLRWIFFASIYFFVRSLSPYAKKRIPTYMVISGTIITLIGFFQYYYNDFTSLSYLDWDIHWYRLFSTFIDPNFAGAFLILCFLLAVSLLIKTPIKTKKTFLFLTLGTLVLFLGVLMTFSRTALLGLIFGVGALAFFLKKGKWIFLVIATLFVLGIIITLVNAKYSEGAKLFRALSAEARLTSISTTATIIRGHPILGVGFNAFRYARHKYGFAVDPNWQYSHSDAGTDNSILFVLATTGIAGITGYIYLIYKIIKLVAKDKKNPLRAVTFASMVAILITSLTLNTLFYPVIMAWMWMLLGLTENR